MKINRVYNMNCIEGSKYIKDNSVDMVFCDLPFGETNNSWDKIIPFDILWEIINRVKKEKFGSMFICKR